MARSRINNSPSPIIMNFLITEIEFDFDGEDDMDAYDKDKLTCEVIGTTWTVDDEDELVDRITDSIGWCIKSIQYEEVI